jgi:hypothetical protein
MDRCNTCGGNVAFLGQLIGLSWGECRSCGELVTEVRSNSFPHESMPMDEIHPDLATLAEGAAA